MLKKPFNPLTLDEVAQLSTNPYQMFDREEKVFLNTKHPLAKGLVGFYLFNNSLIVREDA